jgi:outer membrane lipoprotein-sorting protein
VKTVRDELLGAALRQLETPEHRPSFHAELERLLAAEAAGRRPVRRPRPRLRWGLRVAFVAAVAALAVVMVDLLRSGDAPGPGIGVQQATAAEIQAEVRSVLAGLQTVSGEFVAEGESYEEAYDWTSHRWRFVLAENGDFGLTGVSHEENLSYNARRGVRRTLNPSESLDTADLFANVERGIAPGPPDSYPPESILETDYAALVRAFLAADDPRVVETEYAGRPAWRLDVNVQVNRIVPEYSGDEFSIWVDQETGIPVQIVERKNGRVRNELRLENVAVDAPGARVRPVRFPPGIEVTRSDGGFRRTSLDGVQPIVGYAPLVPAWVPEGYELAEVAVGPGEVGFTGAEAGNPPSTDVVSLSFRRGFDQFIVTTRIRNVPGHPQEWGDPLATGEGFVDRPQTVALSRGALSGVEANVLVVPRNIPHLWAQTDDLVVTVGGDLSREELVRVAESLEPQS